MSDWKLTLKSRASNFFKELLTYFNVKDDLESQQDVELSIRSGVSFKGSQLLTLIFAIFIASLGLNTNSVPVIIGAMLISPLMGPIIGMGLGIGIQDYELLKRGLKNITAAVLGSILTSALYFLISPQYEGSSQLLARTSPSIYDVLIALFGGAAGILSIAAKNKGQVMPGVAIATSLMPPLCTVGYGLATMQMHFFLGALYLFFTNMIFILFATWIGVKMMGFKNVVYQNPKRANRVQTIVYSVVAATIGVSIWLTVMMISKNVFIDKATRFVETEMVFPNTQVLNHKIVADRGERSIEVTLIGQSLPKDSLQLAMLNKLDSAGLGGTRLYIKQGFSMDNDTRNPGENADQFYRLMQGELMASRDRADSLQRIVALHKQFSDESVRVAPEVKVLFPTVKDIALARMVAAQVGGEGRDTLNILFVNAPGGLNAADRTRLTEYMEVRLGSKDLHLTLNPAAFPWPSASKK
ncbi:MAG: TIGR00341 family protein [Muribaculaceae bacterium]|nr:TIGR00341 family protein [Muribaculaceae bacterium]